MMCHEAPCTAVCPSGCDPAAFLRNVRFGLDAAALAPMMDCDFCGACEASFIHYDQSLRITQVFKAAAAESAAGTGPAAETAITGKAKPKADLSISFCGCSCENPFFLSSSVVAGNYEMCARALRAGWGGIVYKTIGAEPAKELSPRFDMLGKERTPFVGFRNLEQISDRPLKENIADLKKIKEEFPSKIVVASILGMNEEEWTFLAGECEKARVDIIELNFSCPHMSAEGLGSDVGQDPALVEAYTRAAKRGTDLPLLAKMTPNLGSMIPPAEAALQGGAAGIAAINTIKSFTGFNPGTLKALLDVSGSTAVSGYSGKAVKPIALRFVSEIKTWKTTAGVPFSGMGGIETWQDALDFLLLGCENIQITTAVMQYGYRIIEQLVSGLSHFLSRRGYRSLKEIIGRGLPVFAPAGELDRETRVYPEIDGERCTACGRCYISCSDGGHQAIRWDGGARIPEIDKKKCAGCHLCVYVCPSGSIRGGARVLYEPALQGPPSGNS
jgi:dihydropyrimidine dehydrogenase (NAD+) subunit PreA